MNLLFEECKTALGKNINIIDDVKQQEIILSILDTYLTEFNTIDLSIVSHCDYSSVNVLLETKINFLNDSVYVVADSLDVPIFESKLKHILEKIEDVTALSPKTFIFNNRFMLQEIFPSSILRFSQKRSIYTP